VSDTETNNTKQSATKIIASTDSLQIELVDKVGTTDNEHLIEISESLAIEYGEKYLLTEKTIDIYFNRDGSLPFIARYRNNIIGYIIGLPIELLSQEPWARLDEHYGKFNTIYTYAFVIKKECKGDGTAKSLKKVYLNWAKKRKGIRFVTGHVKLGISSNFNGNIKIVGQIENWQGTGKTFEYYRRELDPEQIYAPRTEPPLTDRL